MKIVTLLMSGIIALGVSTSFAAEQTKAEGLSKEDLGKKEISRILELSNKRYSTQEIGELKPEKEILELNPNYTLDDLKKAFRKKSLLVHPDKHRNSPESTAA